MRRREFVAWVGGAAAGPLAASSAQVTVYFSYADWEMLPELARIAYVAGTMDSLSLYTYTEEEKKMSREINSCIRRAGMPADQLAANIQIYAKTRPRLQTGTVQMVMLEYLKALCRGS